MKRPTISVCVVTYNQHAFIETCLRSILDQRVDADVNVLVGDDASTDGTSNIIKQLASKYRGRLQHIRWTSNKGAFANMHDLFSCVESDFVARVDGDDYWLPGKLARQLAYLHDNPDCRAVYCNAITVDESTRQTGLFNDVGDMRIDLPTMLRRGNILNNSSILFRAEDIHAWTNPLYQIDYQVHLWLARDGWLGHIGAPLAAYRTNVRGSLVSSSNNSVREMYWQAIQSVPRDAVTDDDYAHGLADFMRRVFFRAIRTRDLFLLRTWARRVYTESPYGTIRTTSLIAKNIVRMASKTIAANLHFSGHKKNILYRH